VPESTAQTVIVQTTPFCKHSNVIAMLVTVEHIVKQVNKGRKIIRCFGFFLFILFFLFKESFTCTQVGNYPDPVKCYNYYQCTVNPDGTYTTTLIKCTTKTLSTGATLQYLYDPALGLCVLPSKFVSYSGQTCTIA